MRQSYFKPQERRGMALFYINEKGGKRDVKE